MTLSSIPTRTLLVLILFFAFVTRIVRLEVPQRYIFDEVYHAVTAKLIAHNDSRAFEWWNPPPEPDTAVDWLHPPLAKYTQAAAMLVVGETSFGWRISSVIFGVGVVWLTFVLTKVVLTDERMALLAAFLASLDGLLLTQSRIAMNDIHVTFFILLTLICYWQLYLSRNIGSNLDKKSRNNAVSLSSKWLLATAVSLGLAIGTKWSGFFLWVVIGSWESSWWLMALLPRWKQLSLPQRLSQLGQMGQIAALLVLVPLILYVSSYIGMFAQGKSLFCFQERSIQGQCYFERWEQRDEQDVPVKTIWEGYTSHFGELHRQIWWYQTGLTATHTYQSRPWEWFFNLRPVWFHVNYVDDTTIANIYAQSNPALAWIGVVLILLTCILFVHEGLLTIMAVTLLTNLKAKQLQMMSLLQMITGANLRPLGYVLSAYLLVWVPWVLSPRIMFFYHYTPAVPLLCIIMAFWLSTMLTAKNARLRQLALSLILVIMATFIIWYPNWTAIPVSKTWADTVYFALPAWK